jgi:ATPase subunit of ABC transporter with duplicated ATPase domains
LESITALNEGLAAFPEAALFTSHNRQFVSTFATRVLEITPGGLIDRCFAKSWPHYWTIHVFK